MDVVDLQAEEAILTSTNEDECNDHCDFDCDFVPF